MVTRRSVKVAFGSILTALGRARQFMGSRDWNSRGRCLVLAQMAGWTSFSPGQLKRAIRFSAVLSAAPTTWSML
jgi:hypothetical protein